MSNNEVTGLPVVNQDGILVANISASDLRTTHRSTVKHVLRPILEFIAYSHDGNIPAPINVTRDAPLLHAMKVRFSFLEINEVGHGRKSYTSSLDC